MHEFGTMSNHVEFIRDYGRPGDRKHHRIIKSYLTIETWQFYSLPAFLSATLIIHGNSDADRLELRSWDESKMSGVISQSLPERHQKVLCWELDLLDEEASVT
jgi:hypothetical protein